MNYNFEWDPAKAKSNLVKHGVSFELASGVFRDPMALTIFDEDSSDAAEDRWITLGMVNGQHYLIVVHTFRGESEGSVNVRLISARPATKHEIKQYEG
ncbi:BrnT family toxin [Salinibius halmophilus]|uniref:BrnT family toxin n=1 Tax=Salinibius halmophilus TaxID=1853216 RepID=UPI000E6675A6|nr:BrnT family toxin [Salinibius halmophilus]